MRPAPDRGRAVAILTVLSLVLAGVGLLGSTSGQQPEPDLVVADVAITGADPQWVYEDATNTTFTVTVENRGDASAAGYTLEYAWTANGTTTPLNGQTRSSTDGSAQPLSVGASRTLEAPWRLQPDQKGAGWLNVTVSASGTDANRSNDTTLEPVFVPYHALEMTLEGNDQGINPDETIFHRVHINNPGNVPEPVNVSVAEPDAGNHSWLKETFVPPNQTILPGANQTATVLYHFPFKGEDPLFTTNYTIRVNTTYDHLLANTSANLTTVYEGFPPGYNASLNRTLSGTLFTNETGTAHTTLNLTNTGDHNDTYRIHLEAPLGWTVNGPLPFVALNPNETRTLNVTIQAPPDAEPGTFAPVQIHAVSNHTLTTHTQTLPVRTHGPAPTVDAMTITPKPTYADENATLTITLANPGNEPTPPEAKLLVTMFLPDASSDVLIEPPSVAPGGTHLVNVSVPLGPSAGEATLVAGWSTQPAPPEKGTMVLSDAESPWKDASLTVPVRAPSLSLEQPDALSARPGARASYLAPPYTFTLTNPGDTPETVQLSLNASLGEAQLTTSPRATISAGDRIPIAFTHDLPSDVGDQTTATVTLSANIVDHAQFNWTLATATDIEDPTAPHVDWEPLPDARVWQGENLTVNVSAEDNDQIDQVVLLHTNTTSATTRLNLTQNEDGQVWTGNVSPTGLGDHTLLARAVDEAGNEATSDPVTVELRPPGPRSVSILEPADEATLSPPVTVRVATQDAANTTSGVLRVLDATGAVLNQVYLPFDEAGTATLTFPELAPGNKTLIAQANGTGTPFVTETKTVTIPAPMQEDQGGQESQDDEAEPTSDDPSGTNQTSEGNETSKESVLGAPFLSIHLVAPVLLGSAVLLATRRPARGRENASSRLKEADEP